MGTRFKRGVFVVIFIVLLLPLIQLCVPFISGDGLNGYFTNAKDIHFSWDKWFDGAYQSQKDSFYNDHAGFRPGLVRVNNQLEYSLYGKEYGGAVVGKNHCLFYDDYIYSYFGLDYMGYAVIHEKLRKLKAIQDTLARLGKSLIVVYAPNKAYYYPEDIPEKMQNLPRGPTNFHAFVRIGDSLGINQVDLNSWFVSMKGKSKELLYPRQGTHWSVYGSLIGGDSIVKYIEKLGHVQMPHPVWTKIDHVINARDSDDDIFKVANLIFPVADEVYSYPSVKYREDSATRKLNVIFIGDSFVMNLIHNNFIQNEFGNWQFWFYFRLLCNNNDNEGYSQPNPQLNDYWKVEIKKTDCLILMYTSRSLPQFGNGFIEKAYSYYYPQKNKS